MLSTMSGVCIEDDALRFTFFMGGICMIANTAAIMSKSILKLYLNQVTHLKKYTRPPASQVHRENNSTTQYDDHANLLVGNSDDGHMYLRNRKAPLMKLCNSSNHKLNQESNTQKSVSKEDLVVKSSDPPLIRLLFVSCIIESICVMLSGIDHTDASEQFSTCCNNSSQTKDCITFNTIVVLQKQCVLPFLCTLMICALSTFPISFLFTKHCFISWSRCIVSSTIFVFAILLSRCFGFLFLPHLLQGQMQSYLFQRLLLSWIVCFFMCLGVCLTKHPVPTIHAQTANFTSDMDHTDKGLIEHYENFNHESQSTKMSTEQTNSILKPSKRIMRRSISDLAFTSDAFMPCVVLMKKHMPSMYKPHLNIGTMPKDRPARVRRRASLDVIKEHNSVIEARKWSDMMERRRTSLPAILASSKRKAVMSSVLVDTATLVDVQGTLEDLASNPGNAEELVKKLQVLLKPYKTDHIKPRQVVWLHDSTTDGSDEDSASTCTSPRHMGKRPSSRRPDWPGASGDIFSTTTTATGLPTEEPAPGNPKRIPKVKKEKTPVNSPFESHSGSPTCDGPLPSGMGRRKTFPTLQEQITTTFFPSANVLKQNRTVLSSDYESGDTDDSPSRCRSKSVNEAEDSERTNSDRVSPTAPDHAESYSVARVNNHSPLSDDNRVLAMSDERCRNESDDDGCVYFDDYQGKLLESVHNWNFQIFDLSEGTPNVLSQMAFKLFQDTGLFDTFKIPKQEFVKYMMTLERGYQQIPYHNRIHAADVLHGCWFLSTQDIPGFQDYYPLSSSDSSDSDSGTGTSHTRHVNNIGHGSLAQAIPALELMALYLAASMHDFEHPGRTNAFLVETRHPLAILYNDRSVLENHHASASWNLLYSNKNFDFLKNLTTAEWKRLRFLIVEAILATDLKKHREILSQFTAKSQRPRQPSDDDSDCNRLMKTGINWSADEDRLLVCQMVIKLADIGGPAKSRHLHITWTKAICEEFFLQGDEERELGVPVSPFMDREHPQVAELQRTFIINLIKTMIVSMHKTGILAGAIAGDEDDTIEGGQSPKSLLLEQLKDNLSFWKLNNFSSGHEEMVEAFKLALPVNLSLTRRKSNNQPSAQQAMTVTHSPDHQPPYYDVTKGEDDANDDVFSKKTASRQNKRFHDVISTSSKTLKSPPSQEKSRPQSKLQQPKTVVNRTALQRPTRK